MVLPRLSHTHNQVSTAIKTMVWLNRLEDQAPAEKVDFMSTMFIQVSRVSISNHLNTAQISTRDTYS